jgi:mRNA interferase MazF
VIFRTVPSESPERLEPRGSIRFDSHREPRATSATPRGSSSGYQSIRRSRWPSSSPLTSCCWRLSSKPSRATGTTPRWMSTTGDVARGDVVLVSYPLISTGLVARKLRPAVVVSNDVNNRRLPDVTLIPLTSKTQRPLETTHLFLSQHSPEGQQAGIRLDSVVKAETILTLPKALIHHRIGHMLPLVHAQPLTTHEERPGSHDARPPPLQRGSAWHTRPGVPQNVTRSQRHSSTGRVHALDAAPPLRYTCFQK